MLCLGDPQCSPVWTAGGPSLLKRSKTLPTQGLSLQPVLAGQGGRAAVGDRRES